MPDLSKIFTKIWIKRKIRRIYFLTRLSDVMDWITIRRKEPLVPLTRDIWGGPALNSLAFYKWSLGDIELFKNLAKIKPNYQVLDVGCGIGRCALGFSRFLDNSGSYDGFDARFQDIEICKKFEHRYTNFKFQHVDLKNSFYNPNGKLNSSEFSFPYDSNKFDFVFLISVFTHMFPDDIKNYTKEISRVLKKGGRCFITFFIKDIDIIEEDNTLNKKSLKPAFSFKNKRENHYIEDTSKPEFAVAYKLEYIKEMLSTNNLTLKVPPLPGLWKGKGDYMTILKSSLKAAPNFTRFQDIVVVEKI